MGSGLFSEMAVLEEFYCMAFLDLTNLWTAEFYTLLDQVSLIATFPIAETINYNCAQKIQCTHFNLNGSANNNESNIQVLIIFQYALLAKAILYGHRERVRFHWNLPDSTLVIS